MENSSVTKRDREFLILEFNALREEILALKHRVIKEFTIGLTGIPIIIGASLTFQVHLLLILSPVITVAGALMLLYEQQSIMRAGCYIREMIEPKLRDCSDIGWERFLEDKRDHRAAERHFRMSTILTFTLYYLGGTVIAFFTMEKEYGEVYAMGVAFIYASGFLFYVYFVWKNMTIHAIMLKSSKAGKLQL